MTTGENDGAEVARSALAKASWRILPLLAVGYCISYIDRVNISFAALQMNHALHFSATVYGLGAGLFFVTYALLEVPSNMLLVRFGARRWIARIMLTWGALAIGMMFVRTPLQFYIMRLLLGAAEAGFFPGVVYYLTQWFPAAHRGRAISRFYVSLPLSSVIMGGLAGVLLGLQGRLGLAGWQWLFLVEGLPAVIVGVVILFLLPDRPQTAKWLSADEKASIVDQLAREAAGRPAVQGHNLLHALRNPIVIQFAAVNFLFLGTNYAFNLSAPAVLTGVTRWSAGNVGYLTACGGLLGAVAMLFNGWRSDRTGERYFHLIVPLVLMGLAFGVMSLTRSPLAFVGAYILFATASAAASTALWLAPAELLRPAAAAVSIAAINSIGQLGSFVSPYLWGIAKDRTGSFHLGLMVLPFPFLIAACIVYLVRSQARAGAAIAATA